MSERRMTYMIQMTLFLVLLICIMVLFSGCCAFEHKICIKPVVFEDETYRVRISADEPVMEDELR